MSLVVDMPIDEPVIGAVSECEHCGGRLVNDEVWGWLHIVTDGGGGNSGEIAAATA